MSRAAACLSDAALLVALTGTTASAAPHVDRVSTAADGTQGDKASSAAVTTPNGRFVAFRSSATDLVPEGITHPGTYSYVRDLRTGQVTKLENTLSTGVWGDAQDSAGSPEISANGRHIAYQWSGRPQFPTRIDLYDRVTGPPETVSAGPADSTRDMGNPSLSGDGRLVAYQDNGTGDVWVADRVTGTQTEVDDGTRSTVVQLSVNGRVLVMDSVDGSSVRDLRTDRVRYFPGVQLRAVSPDGRRLLLQDGQSNLWLLHGGHRELVGNGGAVDGSVSDRGRSVGYSTAGADVVPGDTNGVHDVFQWRSR
ncbi:TolB family protein [Streptomyces canus]|uniref:TolB family protein n=1 Tax=Streptomyces canus TaxID=58343 RepID=UPI0033A26971